MDTPPRTLPALLMVFLSEVAKANGRPDDLVWALNALVWEAMGRPAGTMPAINGVHPEIEAFLLARAEAADRSGSLSWEMRDIAAAAARRAHLDWEAFELQNGLPQDVVEFLARFQERRESDESSRPAVEEVLAKVMARQGLPLATGRPRTGKMPVEMEHFLANHAEACGRTGRILWALVDVVRAEARREADPAGSGTPTGRVGKAGGEMSRKQSSTKTPGPGNAAAAETHSEAGVTDSASAGDDQSGVTGVTSGEPLLVDGGADSAPLFPGDATDDATVGLSDSEAATPASIVDRVVAPVTLEDAPGTSPSEPSGAAGFVPEEEVSGASTPGPTGGLRPHPAADLFPMLGDEQLAELAADIHLRGLVEPIVTITVDGAILILDGRNRYRACFAAGVEPRTVPWDGTGGSPTGFVLAKNIHRRHLTPSQRAAIAVDLLPMLEAEARERQVAAAAATNARVHLALVEDVPEPSGETVVRGRSRDIAASALGVSGRSVGDAKAIAEAAPEVLVEVKAGNLSIPEGKRIAALPGPEERKEAIADAKSGKGARKEPIPKAADPAPVATDTLAPVRIAVTNLGKLLDAMPKAERPIWWTPLRKALRAVGAK